MAALGEPLVPGHTYAVILSTAGVADGGVPVTALTRRYGAQGYDGHFVAFRNDSAHADIVWFLSQAVTGAEAPQVGP